MATAHEFKSQCTLFFNEILGISCSIDEFNTVADDFEAKYTLGGYTVIRIPGHACLVIIWSASNCIFANLETQIMHINIYNSQTHGTLKNVKFQEPRQLKLLFQGIRDTRKPSTDIYSQKHFMKAVHRLDYEQMTITYMSSDVISYANGSMPEL